MLPRVYTDLDTEGDLPVPRRLRFEPTPDKSGGLKGSTHHWLAVYPPEFETPKFFVGVD